MSRVVNPDSGRGERDRLLKAIVKAIRLLMTEQGPGDDSRDLAAFITLALYHVSETIDQSVVAWEKRGYWLKADRYRMEWEWSQAFAVQLHSALLKDDWDRIIPLLVQVGQKLNHLKVPQRDRLGTPWTGAWTALHERPGPAG